MSSRSKLPAGLYDQPITKGLDDQLEQLADELKQIESLDKHHAKEALARLLYHRAAHAFGSISGDDALEKQRDLVNALLSLIDERAPKAGVAAGDFLSPPSRRLLAVHEAPQAPAKPEVIERPQIPLSVSDLLVNGPHDLSVGPELAREILSADRIDLLCSFLKWSGLRLLEEPLRQFTAKRPGRLRVLTTAYMGATERRALDALEAIGAEVRVSYDTTRTRLHAKAWLLNRDTGFSTAFIGSSNLSRAAMLDGLEWNVRLSQTDNGAILDKFSATFEQYWAEGEFRPYEAETFTTEVATQRNQGAQPFLRLDIEPKPHQQEILDDLAAERSHGHTRNLVVAATGTGKTIVAALDYRRLRKELANDRLLFVAHRQEILDQSLSTFRVVLREGDFGERLGQGMSPVRWDHLFASVQSLHAERLGEIPPDRYDVIIVDEFHHARAPTYERLLSHLKPRVLLGLTATPERMDGKSVLGYFDDRIASELRLWKALDQELLSPFHYFGLGGAPDLQAVKWSGGRYDVAQLSNVYTADYLFAQRVIQEVAQKVGDVASMKALGFCVDIAHAEFMADRFRQAGIAAEAVSADTPTGQRQAALARLRDGGLRVLFSVNLFNEGVDLPDVDTVIFLRPTESSTLFLQQLGRGLRRTREKDCLTVLDFIGNAHRKFRFDQRFRAILGGTRRGVATAIERGFPSLPAGCAIQLDRESQRAILDNIKHALGLGPKGLVEDLRQLGRSHADINLQQFLEQTQAELEDIYLPNGPWCWTRLRRAAGLELRSEGPFDQAMERALGRMLHLDDWPRLEALKGFVAQPRPPAGDPRNGTERMLFMLLGHVREPLSQLGEAWRTLWESPGLRDELLELLELLEDRSRRLTLALPEPIAHLPLQVHATYSLDEVMAAVDERTKHDGIKRIQTGVYYLERLRTDLLFVTLEKSEKDYSPTTLYKDYPLSPTRFHWETQSNCHADTPTGRRYLRSKRGSGDHVLLFVRQRRKDDRGQTMPYTLLGPCFYRLHHGGRPMQIEWDLEHRMPAWLYQEVKVAAG